MGQTLSQSTTILSRFKKMPHTFTLSILEGCVAQSNKHFTYINIETIETKIKSSPKSLCSEIYIESDKVHATTAPLSHPSKQVIVVVRVTPLPLSFSPTASSDPLGAGSLFLFSRLPSILTLH